MKVEKVDRVVIGVKDLDEAMVFFNQTLGIKFDEVRENEQANLRATFSSVGFEMVQPTAEDTPLARFISKRGEGVYAVVFKVPDIEEAKRVLQGKGARLIAELHRGGLKEAFFHPKDFHGMEVVLCEYEAPHPATCAALHV